MDAFREADTFCPYLENHHGDQEHNGKRHPNCNHAVHAPERLYVCCYDSQFTKYSQCQKICLHGCMFEMTRERQRHTKGAKNRETFS